MPTVVAGETTTTTTPMAWTTTGMTSGETKVKELGGDEAIQAQMGEAATEADQHTNASVRKTIVSLRLLRHFHPPARLRRRTMAWE